MTAWIWTHIPSVLILSVCLPYLSVCLSEQTARHWHETLSHAHIGSAPVVTFLRSFVIAVKTNPCVAHFRIQL